MCRCVSVYDSCGHMDRYLKQCASIVVPRGCPCRAVCFVFAGARIKLKFHVVSFPVNIQILLLLARCRMFTDVLLLCHDGGSTTRAAHSLRAIYFSGHMHDMKTSPPQAHAHVENFCRSAIFRGLSRISREYRKNFKKLSRSEF